MDRGGREMSSIRGTSCPQGRTVEYSRVHRGILWLRRSSSVLGVLGITMVMAGIALIVVGAIVPNGRVAYQQHYSDVLRNEEGVPQLGAQGQAVVGLDCQTHLHDRDRYEEAALAAETKLFGKEVSALSVHEGRGILGNLSEFSVSISFWVLHSYPIVDKGRTERIMDDQIVALNKAFAGANVRFVMHGRGIYFVQVDKKTESNCHNKAYTKEILSRMNSFSSLVVFVCNLEEVNGVSGVYGDSVESRDDTFHLSKSDKSHLGVIYTRMSALDYSPTSLVHQMGHILGLPHPFPSYETCKVDGDFIADTQPVYRRSESCSLKETPFCDPSRVERDYLFLPGNLYMDTSPDVCRDTFTPGQILRMHAMMADMVSSGEMEYIQETNHDDNQSVYALTEPFEVAWQSDIPEYLVLEAQMKTYFKGTNPTEIKTSFLEHRNPFTRNSQYAMLATLENDHDTAISTCFPKESENNSFWIGELKATVPIVGIELTQELSALSDTSIEKPVKVLVQVASSSGGYTNCTDEFIPLDSLTKVIMCKQTIQGSSIKFILVGNRLSNLCIEHITVLSSQSDMLKDTVSSADGILSAWQSSTMGDLTADKSLVSSENTGRDCSSTQPGTKEQWNAKLTRPFLIHSVQFEYAGCSTEIADFSVDSNFLQKVSQALQVCMSPSSIIPLKVSFALAGETVSNTSREGIDFCANDALIVPGNLVTVRCRQNTLVRANLIQVKYRGPRERPVTLCDARIHAYELVPIATVASLSSQEIYPPSVENQYIRALDNNEHSCITVSENVDAYITVYFKEKTDINALLLQGQGNSIKITLLDESDDTLWNSTVSLPNRMNILSRTPSVPASSLKLSGFSQLCNILVGTTLVRI